MTLHVDNICRVVESEDFLGFRLRLLTPTPAVLKNRLRLPTPEVLKNRLRLPTPTPAI